MEQIRITTEICIPNARRYVPLEQLAEYPFVKKPEEYIDGIITVDCGEQGNALDGCIGELWQCVLNALEQLCETDEAVLCCPVPIFEFTVRILKSKRPFAANHSLHLQHNAVYVAKIQRRYVL